MTRLAMAIAVAVSISILILFGLLLMLLVGLCRTRLRHRRARQPHHDGHCIGVEIGDEASEGSPGMAPVSKPLHSSMFPFYGHGVLQAPTGFLLSIPDLEAAAAVQLPSPSFLKEVDRAYPLASSPVSIGCAEHFIRICNPIYDEACEASDNICDGETTPFETPETSPSCFDVEDQLDSDCSPPLSFMKKLAPVLPPNSSAVCLIDGRRSLAPSVSATDTNRASSSCSSNSMFSSPSW